MTRARLSLRAAIGIAAWLGLSAAIWYGADAIALGEHHPFETATDRLLLIALLAVAWFGNEWVRARGSHRSNERLLAELARGGGDDSQERAAHEVATLREKFEQALTPLRSARFTGPGGARLTVNELPWYMFIGAPGSGKTTALLNAGLRFIVGEEGSERAIRGVGGTRNCDWWFTEQAVLLDTAGRYTTQESDREADSAAWLGFLDLLKRQRPGQPLNGAIVTLSVSDIVHWNAAELERYADHVSERLAELQARLGIRFPVYCLVTKSDMLAGFAEFFADLDAGGRGQVWGTTFSTSESESGALARAGEELAALETRLYAMLPARLQAERDLQRRAAIYRFPQQFKAALPPVEVFLRRAFRARGDASAARPYLRGVYFTSGTQEGSPIDRVLSTLARSFNLEQKMQPPAIGGGKSYFLRRLLRDVMFAEAGLAGADLSREDRLHFTRNLAYAAIAAVTVGLTVFWTASYVANRHAVAAAAAGAAEVRRALEDQALLRPGDEARLVQTLSELRDIARAQRRASWTQAGLDQGDKIAAQAERAYRTLLRDDLLTHLSLSLEQALRSAPDAQLLQAYLALYDPARRDTQPIEQAAQRLWKPAEKWQADLQEHLRAGLAEGGYGLQRARNDTLVDQARRRLGGARKT